MKISFPVGNPTNFITVPDPDFRDQTQINIATTFKRMYDGSIVPFNQLPPQETVNFVFNSLKYKKAREFLDFLLLGENQYMRFQTDSGTSGAFLDSGDVNGTVLTDPIALITKDSTFKSLALTVSLQETIPLQPKHVGSVFGNQERYGDCSSYYIVGDGGGNGRDTDEYARFKGFDGVWSKRQVQPNPANPRAIGFTLENIIYVSTGRELTTAPSNRTNSYEPLFDALGFWTELQAQTGVSRYDAGGFSFGGRGFAIGGIGSTGGLISCVEEFVINPSKFWITSSFQLCLGIKDTFSFSLAGKSYVGGGNTGATSGVLRSFDGIAWVEVLQNSIIALEKAGSGGVIAEGKGLIFGGNTSVLSEVDSTIVFDEDLGTVSVSGTTLPTTISGHASASLGDAIYSVAGFDGVTTTPVNNEYTFDTNVWVARLPLITPDRSFALAPCSNLGGTLTPADLITPPPLDILPASVVVLGGEESTGVTKEAYRWDFGTLTTNVAWDMPSPRMQHQVASILGSVYVVDGLENSWWSLPTESFWEFDASNVWTNRSLKGNALYDAQPRDTTARAVVASATCDSYNKSLYLISGSSGAGAAPIKSGTTLVQSVARWDSLNGWKAQLLSLSTEESGAQSVSGVLFQSVRNLLPTSGSGDSFSGIIYYFGGFKPHSDDGFGTRAFSTFRVFAYIISINVALRRTNYPTFVSLSGCTNLDGSLYGFALKNDLGQIKNDTYLYAATTDVWSLLTVNIAQTYDSVAYAYSNTTDVNTAVNFGGWDTNGKVQTIQTFNKTTKSWSLDASSFPTGRSNLRAAAVGNTLTPTATKRMLVTHGFTPTNLRAETFTYNPAGGNFTFYPSWGRGMRYAVMEAVVALSIVIGKISSTVVPDGSGEEDYNTIAFSHADLTWVKKTRSNLGEGVPRAEACSGVLGGSIFIGGGKTMDDGTGFNDFKGSQSIHEYNVFSDFYTVHPDPNFIVSGFKIMGTVIGVDFYMFGGKYWAFNGSSFIPSMIASYVHFKIDLTTVGVGMTTTTYPVTYAEWRVSGVYEQFDSNTNIIIGGEETANYSLASNVIHFNLTTFVYSSFTTSPVIRGITGQKIDSDIFICSGERRGGIDLNPLVVGGLISGEEFVGDSAIYKYSPSNTSFSTVEVISSDGIAKQGTARASSSF